MGYHIAGFEVIGFDIEYQPDYPFEFYEADFTKLTAAQKDYIRSKFSVIAGSPPCQVYSKATPAYARARHRDLIPSFRSLCREIALPYVIENVVNAPLLNPIQLCGSAFGLPIQRHRLFESNVPLKGVACKHEWQERYRPYDAVRNGPESAMRTGVIRVAGGSDGTSFNNMSQIEIWRHAMGINWMNILDDLSQAIPPAYTHFLGDQLIKYLEEEWS
jgi:DNA (cytosine-5)-methyltransferase 1